jgi:hypothetical protein
LRRFLVRAVGLTLVWLVLAQGQAVAEDELPILLYDSASIQMSMGKGPFDEPPTGIYLGYGVVEYVPNAPMEEVAFLFDDEFISPSSEPQEFYAYVAGEEEAAELVELLRNDLALSRFAAFGSRFHDDHAGYAGGSDTALELSSQADVEYLLMTVAPFTIKKVLEPTPFGGIVSVYTTSDMIVTVEAFGPPPPGDAGCDAHTSSIDALLVLQFDAGLVNALECAKVADVLQDGAVDSRDAALILQFNASLVDQL